MSGCLPLSNNADSYIANNTPLGRAACTSARPTHVATPFESLVSYLVKHSAIPPLISTSRVYAPYCSLTVPLLDEILSTSPLLRLPVEIITSSSEQCEVESLWDRVSDGDLNGDGWERIDVRLLEDSPSVLGEGRFSHIFVHVASRASEVEKAVERLLPNLKRSGALVITSWDRSWECLLEEAAKAIGHSNIHLMERSVLEQGDAVKEPKADTVFQTATLDTVRWVGHIVVAEWNAEEVLNWISEDREVVTTGWSLVEKARFEQALRKVIMRRAAEDGMLQLKASAVICTKP